MCEGDVVDVLSHGPALGSTTKGWAPEDCQGTEKGHHMNHLYLARHLESQVGAFAGGA